MFDKMVKKFTKPDRPGPDDKAQVIERLVASRSQRGARVDQLTRELVVELAALAAESTELVDLRPELADLRFSHAGPGIFGAWRDYVHKLNPRLGAMVFGAPSRPPHEFEPISALVNDLNDAVTKGRGA
jgi:hypothetical protein